MNKSRRSFIRNLSLTGLTGVGLNQFPTLRQPLDVIDADSNFKTFLFQGDSITDGNRGRNNDPNHIMGHGYAFSIASRVGADFPKRELQFFNRGISGNKIIDLTNRWQQDAIDLKPDVLSILVGVNDVNAVIKQGESNSELKFEETFTSLLQETKKALPNCLLILCEPFLLPVGRVKEDWDRWQKEMSLRQKIVRSLANQFDAVFVPLQSVFDKACTNAPAEYWMWDGIHPTVAGHELVTRAWLKNVSAKISFLKSSLC